MNLAAEAPGWLALVLVLLLIAASAEDAARLRISNVTVVLVLGAAVVAAILAGPELRLWQNVVVFAALLATGTALFASGKLGGGDVKLLAATGLWFDLWSALQMLLCVVLAGGVLALLVLAVRLFNWAEGALRRVIVLRPGGGIPYGVAIAAGALIAMALQRA